MTKKQKRLEALRELIKAGRLTEREHGRQFIEDTDGRHVSLMSAEALEAIERRIAALEE